MDLPTISSVFHVPTRAIARFTRNPGEAGTFTRVHRAARRLDVALHTFRECARLDARLAKAWRRARVGASAVPAMRPALTVLAQSLESNNRARCRLARACRVEEGALVECAAELRRFAEARRDERVAFISSHFLFLSGVAFILLYQ